MTQLLLQKISTLPDVVKNLSEEVNWDHLKDRRVQAGILAGLTTSYILYKQITKPRYNLPPGPMPLPLIGNMLTIGTKDLVKKYAEIGKKYGPIATIYLGPQRTVLLSDMQSIREAYVQKGTDFANRPKSFFFDFFSDGGKSIASGQYGPVWKAQRKIAHSALRKYAQGENIEKLVESSFQKLSVILDKAEGPIDLSEHFMLFVYNIFATMCFGKQYEIDDPFFTEMRDKMKMFSELGPQLMLIETFPILSKDIFGLKVMKLMKEFLKFFLGEFGKEFEEHLANYDPDHLTDFSYDSIHLWKKAQSGNEDREAYCQLTKNHFLFTIFDVFSAGTDTTRITLAFVILNMAYYPEMQKRLHDEIDRVLGKDTHPSLSSKSQLHYLNAVLYETMRFQTIAATGVPHITRCDTTLGKYDIPKDTMVMSILWAVHFDPNAYKDPEKFNPDRWIDENGRFDSHSEGSWIPFSIGKRNCVGEALAKSEIPLALAWFFQRYQFEKAPGETLSTEPNDIMGGLEPKPFKVNVIRRN